MVTATALYAFYTPVTAVDRPEACLLSTEERKSVARKREITVTPRSLAVCKRKYEGAELRYGRPKPAAANANSLAYEEFPLL